jgi:predicted TIM-barrel fold metal-dependent hydrolase
MFAPLADRLTPVAAIPMHTPEEAVAELEYAVSGLGFKAVLCAGYVQRPFDALAGKDPELSRYAFWLDQFGMDSAYDYDPVWARAQELGVSIAFHSGFIGMTPYRSPTSYVFNHLSMLAEGQQSLAKSLFLGGVTRRFPGMNFVFLEGGVAWAAALYSDIVGHWEKRNLAALRANLDPALVDRQLMMEMMGRYGSGAPRLKPDPTRRPPEDESMLDEWAACGISEAADIEGLFCDRFYFGCEADDPLASMAFNTKVNPFGSELKAMMGSDIAHWDVPDVTEVLEEAWEMVEHGWIDEVAFKKFVFTNPARFYTDTNPGFFKGTVVEPAVDRLLAGD